jgi:hypothetical protein
MLSIEAGSETKGCCPQLLVPLIFKYFHASSFGGHLGFFKTRHKIRQNFIWLGWMLTSEPG